MENNQSKPKAFVIMPFAEGFNEIYSLFIQDTLVKAGYDVKRADDMKTCQNILKDIIHGIAYSDLIVADLTESNQNVYYELGIAHSLGKPVVLLAQDIKDIPFDIKSYRVIPYKTHFVEMNKARSIFEDTVKGFLKNSVPFGNPISDFLPEYKNYSSGIVLKHEEELGYLDYLTNGIGGFQEIANIINSINDETNKLTRSTERTTVDINNLKLKPTAFSAHNAKDLIEKLAIDLSNYASLLDNKNDEYAKVLYQTRNSFEWLFKSQFMTADNSDEDYQKFAEAIRFAYDNIIIARNKVAEFCEIYRTFPPIERNFNRAKELVVRQLDRLGEGIDQTIAMISRIKEMLNIQ